MYSHYTDGPSITLVSSLSIGGCALSVVFRVIVALLYVGLARWLNAAVCCAYLSVHAGSTIYFNDILTLRHIDSAIRRVGSNCKFCQNIDGSRYDSQRDRHMRQDCEDRLGFGRSALRLHKECKSHQQDTQLPHRAIPEL